MDVGALLMGGVAVGFAAVALLGLGWLTERSLARDVRRWVKRLRDNEARRESGRERTPIRPGRTEDRSR